MEVLLLFVSFAVILTGALLFTNAIEWLGHRMSLGEGAVGSILAAVGTALPETLIAIVALLGGSKEEEVAIGAIVGAPFMLATIAMMLVGVSALAYRHRRATGTTLDAHAPTVERDLVFFMLFFGLALPFGFGAPQGVRIVLGIIFFCGYAWYVRKTLTGGGEAQDEESLSPLIMDRVANRPEPPIPLILIQALVGLGAMVGGAHLFVEELLKVAESLGVAALVLSLILAPLATELPEKVNSFFWIRDNKDSLALGNITGAMVFQSTIPVGIGLIFTGWDLSGYASLSIVLGLLGGAIAWLALHKLDRFNGWAVAGWGLLYATFFVVVAV